ncbi:MAG: cytochrome c class I [Chitinophagaceae bacterium]|nr:MAG: cytochrome c class I [Chitinophagaceae bacterium]
MKRVWIVSLAIAMLAACNSEGEKKDSKTEDKPAADANDITQLPEYKEGLELIAKSDCFTCHKVDEALTGPTYRDVANKYAGQAGIIPQLADKIIKGGTGVWGQVPMLPHPSLSQEDAEKMVKYILLLKK